MLVDFEALLDEAVRKICAQPGFTDAPDVVREFLLSDHSEMLLLLKLYDSRLEQALNERLRG